jgi:hypothetical protein
MTKETDPILRKIRALLNTAEHPNTPTEEADSAMAMAQRLIAKHAIDQAMLDQSRPAADRGQVTSKNIEVPNPHGLAKAMLANAVAVNNHCRLIRRSVRGGNDQIIVIGFESDLEAFEMAYTSLLLQLTNAARMCGHTDKNWYKGIPAAKISSIRKAFMMGWTSAVDQRLQEAARLASRDAEADHGSSVSVVLFDRSKLVNDKVSEMFPRLGKSSGVKIGDTNAYHRGAAAGRTANIGQKAAGAGARGALR